VQEPGNGDSVNSSLTDLMTSLMVIFVLLLLVFLQRRATGDPAVAEELRKALVELKAQGLSERNIQRKGNVILIVVPDRLMNFESGKFELRPQGQDFLRERVPQIAKVLCSDKYRTSVEAIVVEGHTDAEPWNGKSDEDSKNLNLKLSQDRSMEVVKTSLSYLSGDSAQRACFLEKLSASGRGEQDLEATADESRRVVFKIRVRAENVKTVTARIE
jgi:flagellar motor protein MotB